MSLPTNTIAQTYPLPVYNFRVSLTGNEDSWMSFSEVSGLTMEYGTISYRHGLSTFMGPIHIRTRQKSVNITLKRGIVKSRNELSDWFGSWLFKTLPLKLKKDVLIALCDKDGSPTVTWQVANAFPIKLEAPTFDVNSNDVAIETLELMAEKVSIEYH